jgi:hypothetical protein
MSQPLDEGAQVIEVAGEPVHAVHNQDVPVAGESQQFRELWAARVSARGPVCEDPVQNQAFKLAFLVLIQRAPRTYPIR